MVEQEGCELLAKAKALAIKRGLDSSLIDCPFIGVCTGKRCHMFDRVGDDKESLIVEYLDKWEKKTTTK